MIEVLHAPENVAAFRMWGTVTGGDYDEVVRTIEDKLKRHERIGVYVDATDFRRMTARAVRKRVRYGVNNWNQRRRFSRAGLVTDKRWMSSLTWAVDKLLPGLEARAFRPTQSDAALHWVAEGPKGRRS